MVISTECVKRLSQDVKYIFKNPLTEHNIYYKHDEENMLKGYALIIGPSDTPYAYGYNFFEFNFPENYPYQPPIVVYYSNDGKMRYNPNLYTNGKVCLSVLNTWNGEGWTSCQTISSILLSLATVFNENPLTNEPGIEMNKDANKVKMYNILLSYKNIEFLILKQLDDISDTNDKNSVLREKFGCFREIMVHKFSENYDNILINLKILEENILTNKIPHNIFINVYNLTFKIFPYNLIEKLKTKK